MRRILIAGAIGALALCLTAAPSVAKKGTKDVEGTVTVAPVPSTIEPATTTVAVSGNVHANSSCRKNRTVRFSYIDSAGTTALTETVVTKPNGDYSVTLPKPTTTGPASVTLVATVDQAIRTTKGQSKGKGKKKGHAKGKARKFNCLSITGQSTLTIG